MNSYSPQKTLWKFWSAIKYYIKTFFSPVCVYFYLISCFEHQQFYSIYLMWNFKEILNQKGEKLRNSSCKMKDWIKLFWKKGLFASIKGHLCLIIGHLDYLEGQGEAEFPLTRSCFWYFRFKSRKSFFEKKALFNEVSDSRTLYLSKIGPVYHVMWWSRNFRHLKFSFAWNLYLPRR